MSLKGKNRRVPRLGQHGRGPDPRARRRQRGARESVWASDVRGDRLEELERQYGIQRAPDNLELVRQVDVVILAVKPQIMAAVLREIAPGGHQEEAPHLARRRGVHGSHPRHPDREVRLIRVMPNTPALVLEGAHGHRQGRGARGRRPHHGQRDLQRGGRVVVLDEEA